jgi:hypothetical protein
VAWWKGDREAATSSSSHPGRGAVGSTGGHDLVSHRSTPDRALSLAVDDFRRSPVPANDARDGVVMGRCRCASRHADEGTHATKAAEAALERCASHYRFDVARRATVPRGATAKSVGSDARATRTRLDQIATTERAAAA